ncbi:universal stress protein [Sediminitomix flava]|uniref:Nucleotide-binding universal stress UspA family protein n=1 Tax=Sediminitomix flava TaxID=379075 RepID=A0A315ZFG5_SEDFL|nr:universal stress protein [Sediminitomix flava]PWJ43899.1 nucleotide-binding universal stress UspA family protein [Sediminitomix flava]
MSTYKRILVPTDFSVQAEKALEVAVDIARRTQAEITLLHVVDVPMPAGTDPNALYHTVDLSVNPFFKENSTEYINRKVEVFRKTYEDVTLHTHVVFDVTQKHIAEYISENPADIIVMGTSGVNGIDELLVGSNTEKVIRLSGTPVLSIKDHQDEFEPKTMVFASDFKKISYQSVEKLKAFQALYNTKILFTKIITPNSFETTIKTENTIEDFVKEHSFENYEIHHFNFFSEEEGIRVFAEDKNADLIAMTTHGRTGISHILMGSVAEEVANHSKLAVLTFNQHFDKKD